MSTAIQNIRLEGNKFLFDYEKDGKFKTTTLMPKFKDAHGEVHELTSVTPEAFTQQAQALADHYTHLAVVGRENYDALSPEQKEEAAERSRMANKQHRLEKQATSTLGGDLADALKDLTVPKGPVL